MKQEKLAVFKPLLYVINKAIEVKDLKEHPVEEIVLEPYDEFLTLFSKVLVDRLPPPSIRHLFMKFGYKMGRHQHRDHYIQC